MKKAAWALPSAIFAAVAWFGVFAFPSLALAQQDLTPIRVYEEQLRVQMDQQVPAAREMGLDAGGWFDFAFFNYDDVADAKERTLRQYQFRPWASASYHRVHQLYVRGVVEWDDWNSGTNPLGGSDDRFEGIELERGWYQFDLSQMLRNQTGREPGLGGRFKVGRDFATLGTSFVLAMPLDMLRWYVTAGDLEFTALLGKSITHSRNPVDFSAPVADHQDRCMWGVELAYRGIPNHRPFVYFLNNQDNTEPWGDNGTQAFEYTSRYVGGGSEGSLIVPELHYSTEVVGEWGKTFSDGVTSGRDSIRAWAYDALLEYLFQRDMHPKVGGEYIFASGDNDRTNSSTATIGGNRAGTTDTAFNAFGFRDTGLAFGPRISNINVVSGYGSFFPFEKSKLLQKMEWGAKLFFYTKAAENGAVSDTTATRDTPWLGWEWDLFCNWRITSDVSWTIRYGNFLPGSSFDDRDCRSFLYTGVTLSF